MNGLIILRYDIPHINSYGLTETLYHLVGKEIHCLAKVCCCNAVPSLKVSSPNYLSYTMTHFSIRQDWYYQQTPLLKQEATT